jgi:predicted Zn-dependent protease
LGSSEITGALVIGSLIILIPARRPRLIFGTLIALAGCFATVSCEPPDAPATGEEAVASGSAPPPVSAESVEASLQAAGTYVNAGELVKAEAILGRLVERAPGNVHARELLGQVLVMQAAEADAAGDPAGAAAARREAYEHYRAAAEADAESSGLQQSAGMIALTAGLPEAALAHFRAAEALAPGDVQPPLFAAQVLLQMERRDEARTALQRVLALDPDESRAHASLAVICLEEERYADALDHIAEARAIDPADHGLRLMEARIRRRAGDPRAAVELLAALLPEERADAGITAELAASYTALGEHVKAARAWEHRYERRRTEPTAYLAAVEAARSLLAAGRLAEARLWLEQARLAGRNAPAVRELERELESSE